MDLEYLKKIPPSERWLWENEEALASVMRGLEDARRGRVSLVDKGSFADEEDNRQQGG